MNGKAVGLAYATTSGPDCYKQIRYAIEAIKDALTAEVCIFVIFVKVMYMHSE